MSNAPELVHMPSEVSKHAKSRMHPELLPVSSLSSYPYLVEMKNLHFSFQINIENNPIRLYEIIQLEYIYIYIKFDKSFIILLLYIL